MSYFSQDALSNHSHTDNYINRSSVDPLLKREIFATNIRYSKRKELVA